jgi:hypothetical protein
MIARTWAAIFIRFSSTAPGRGADTHRKGNAMRVHFILNHGGTPASKLADVEIHFEEGLLAGLKLVGCSVWRSKKGERPTVLVPSRSYATAGGIRYYELLRGATSTGMKEDPEGKAAIKRFKEYIQEEYARIALPEAEPEPSFREKHMCVEKGAPTLAEKEAAQG